MGRGSKPRYVWTKMFISEEQQNGQATCPARQAREQKINKINIRKIGKRGLNSLDLIGFRFFFLIHIHTYMSTHKKYSAEGFFVLLPSSTVLWSDVERERDSSVGRLDLSLSLSLSLAQAFLARLYPLSPPILLILIIIPFLSLKSLTS